MNHLTGQMDDLAELEAEVEKRPYKLLAALEKTISKVLSRHRRIGNVGRDEKGWILV